MALATVSYHRLTPFVYLPKEGKRSGFRLYPYSVVKVLLFFQLYHPTKGTIVELQNEPIFTTFFICEQNRQIMTSKLDLPQIKQFVVELLMG